MSELIEEIHSWRRNNAVVSKRARHEHYQSANEHELQFD